MPDYEPAVFLGQALPKISLFPVDGPEISVGAPSVKSFQGLGFSPDGRAIYMQSLEAMMKPGFAIEKIEFLPERRTAVAGTVNLGAVSCFAVLPSGELVVSGHDWSDPSRSRGTFEIDPMTGDRHEMSASALAGCAGEGGLRSPDGKRLLRQVDGKLHLLEPGTGKDIAISGISLRCSLSENETKIICYQKVLPEGSKLQSSHPRATVLMLGIPCAWAPNGRWFFCEGSGLTHTKIALFDANDPSHPKNLATSDGHPVWSPDSTRLLVRIASCGFEGSRLEVVDVPSGKKTRVKSSECFSNGTFGWMDRQAVQ